MYGIVYEMLNAIFQICSLTVAQVYRRKKFLASFTVNHKYILDWQMPCLITHDDADGLEF